MPTLADGHGLAVSEGDRIVDRVGRGRLTTAGGLRPPSGIAGETGRMTIVSVG
jgi:hypothetical protein